MEQTGTHLNDSLKIGQGRRPEEREGMEGHIGDESSGLGVIERDIVITQSEMITIGRAVSSSNTIVQVGESTEIITHR